MHETLVDSKLMLTFASQNKKMVSIAQLVRASDCGSEGRGFDPHTSPHQPKGSLFGLPLFFPAFA